MTFKPDPKRFEGKEVTFVYTRINNPDFFKLQQNCCESFREGFEKLGGKVFASYDNHNIKTKNVAFWGWRPHDKFKNYNKIVFEMGYIGDRYKFTSIATNGLNGFGEFHSICDDKEGVRFNHYFSDLYKPWDSSGENILLIGQTPNDMSLRGKDLMPWYIFKTQQLRKKFPNAVIEFRKHPNLTKKGIKQVVPGTKESFGTLEEAMQRSFLVVCFNSNTAVDALMFGKPVYVEDQGSMCYSIANNHVDKICLNEPQNRKEFLNRLSYCQWTLDEIKTCFPLYNLKIE